MPKQMTAKEAVSTYIHDGATITVGGFANGLAHPEEVMEELGIAAQAGSPKGLTLIYASGQGDSAARGLNHLAVDGLLRKVIGGHWGLAPRLGQLAADNKLAGYNLPQGTLSQLFREIAAGRPGVITHVGLGSFADPRLEGGKLNQAARDEGDFVKVIQFEGEEKLFYPSIPIDVAILRASYADTKGNCTFEREGAYAETLAQAQAAHNSGGAVIVQVERVVEYGSLDARMVRLPGIYVDAIVVAKPENHMQTYGTQYNPVLSGEIRIPMDALAPLPMGERKVIARRAAMELPQDAIVNLGTGAPEKIANVAAEEGISDKMTLTVEAGSIAGVPYGGTQFGAAANSMAILDHNVQFDFYQGGGLDVAFLGLAETAPNGDLNVSKFGTRLAGAGGFIDITQNAKKVVYCGAFKAGGLKVQAADGRLEILQEGKVKKLVSEVEQVTFSGVYAAQHGHPVLYITERAVFELTKEGVELKEIAPGVDLQKDVLDQMDFAPIVKDVTLMDARIFQEEPMGLKL